MKINKQKELIIAINRSADIDYKDFVKIYRKSPRKTASFLKIDVTLPASDPLIFRKDLFHFYKNESS